MDFRSIEKKWQKAWEKERIFQADVSKKKKFFVTFPYPYLNGSMHIGHSYSFLRCDVYARYKRMLGFNVLFPQGFHATGEPLLGAIERVKAGDKVQIETFKSFGASKSELKKFIKNPEYAARFWMKRFIESMKSVGGSIDWRRSFVTAIDDRYSKFIEWQYNTLRKKGYVVQGTHPVIWCPKCLSPTGDHDRLEGEGESPVDYILIKFGFDGYVLPAATLRPETIYGVTNMWVNPNVDYVKANVGNEVWIISEEAAEKLVDQLKDVKITGRIKGEKLVGKHCTDPISNKKIPILPAGFVDPSSATGIVMSVPSHAPYDWIGIKEVMDCNMERYGISKDELEPISLISTPGFGEHPAIEICKRMGINSSKEIEKLDEATNVVYKKEFHLGVLNDNCGEYSGLRVSECKEKLSIEFIERGIADVLWDCKAVVCRCTTKCRVKILENQWFLKYSDGNWKKKVKRCVERMEICPVEAKANFINTVDWLRDKACTRKTGLGTKLPWDNSWIIETLSDSTIYMAYYTIARMMNEKKISADNLNDDVFNYVFLGKGDLKTIAKKSRLKKSIIDGMKNEFDYFYPVDFRNSAKELIQNHLTFFLFHHTALWPDNKWPVSIGVNGFVNVEGEKMSKSRGNVIPISDIIKQFGADLARINIVASSEDMNDADWRAENIKGYRARIEFLFDVAKNMKKARRKSVGNADLFLQSRIQKCVKNASENYDATKFRSAIQSAMFGSTNALKWYLSRSGGIKNANKKILSDSLATVVKLLTPVIPHSCEELWKLLGNRQFVSLEAWPSQNEKLINAESEKCEDLVARVIEDVENIKKMHNLKPKSVSIFVAEKWKFDVYNKILTNKDKPINEITKEIMEEGNEKTTIAFVQSLYKKINEIQPVIERKKQFEILEEAKEFLAKEIKCKIDIINAEKSDAPKAKLSTPQKPGILLE
ncbi:MAG: leucine--tRNA ligase [Candidatus Aenigmatarchaeota archaeon]